MPRPSGILVHRNQTITDRKGRTSTADVHYPESPITTEIAKTTASPAAEPTRPLVIYVHDDTWETGSTGRSARRALDITDGGFVTTEVSHRLGHGTPFSAQIKDVYEGIDWLTDRADGFGINMDAVAVISHSTGAYLVLLAALSNGEFGHRTDIDAAIGVSGVYGLRTDGHEHASGSLSLLENWPSTARLRRCSPTIYVDDDTDADTDAPPMLLLHGSKDPVIAPDQSA